MKKIINGKMYNTETATKLATHANAGSWRDFSHYEEALYRKRTGEYFLAGSGGPMTKYAHSVDGNALSGGDGIFPITELEAREWAEAHMDVDDYCRIFGEPAE